MTDTKSQVAEVLKEISEVYSIEFTEDGLASEEGLGKYEGIPTWALYFHHISREQGWGETLRENEMGETMFEYQPDAELIEALPGLREELEDGKYKYVLVWESDESGHLRYAVSETEYKEPEPEPRPVLFSDERFAEICKGVIMLTLNGARNFDPYNFIPDSKEVTIREFVAEAYARAATQPLDTAPQGEVLVFRHQGYNIWVDSEDVDNLNEQNDYFEIEFINRELSEEPVTYVKYDGNRFKYNWEDKF